jgi:hypothetical protein
MFDKFMTVISRRIRLILFYLLLLPPIFNKKPTYIQFISYNLTLTHIKGSTRSRIR